MATLHAREPPSYTEWIDDQPASTPPLLWIWSRWT